MPKVLDPFRFVRDYNKAQASRKEPSNRGRRNPPSGQDAPNALSSASVRRPGLAAKPSLPACPPTPIPAKAFVLVQHLPPDHKSILTVLVKRYARMKVFEVAERHAAENHVGASRLFSWVV
jgi:chemotaxis response regulator CheB